MNDLWQSFVRHAKRWPVVRHVRWLYWSWRVAQHYVMMRRTLGYFALHRHLDDDRLNAIWRGDDAEAENIKADKLMGSEEHTTTRLVVMRLADMHRVHPDQITAQCSKCGEAVGVYPSGQAVMREMQNVELICQVCKTPSDLTALAPGAELEPFQSRWK